MTFDIEVGNRTRSVEVRGPEMLLDGRRFHVDVARAGHIWSLILGPVDVASDSLDAPTRSYEVAVVERTEGDLTAYVNSRPVSVRSSSPSPRGRGFLTRPRGRVDVAKVGSQRVLAPMPGRIAKVLVKVGDIVAARQGLVVVEAMKMENELRSPSAGTVTELLAVEGALVKANAVLAVIDC